MPGNWLCQSGRDHATSDRAEWNGEQARQRLWDHFGWQGDTPGQADAGSTRSAFLLVDADNLNDKRGYRFPFCDVVDGKLQAVRGGLHSAASQLGTATDVVPRERQRAREVIESYYDTLHAPSDDDERQLLVATMPIGNGRIVKPERLVEIMADGSERSNGISVPNLPESLLAQVHDRDALAEMPLYLFPAAASSNLPDTFGTRMMRSSLSNYVGAAQTGLPLVNSHRKDMLPIGRIYDGRISTQDGVTRAVFEQYMAMGDYEVAGIKTASVVQGIRLGINRDTSIGFYGGRIICSICTRDMPTSFFDILFGDDERMCFDHFMLEEYDELDKAGKPTGQRVTCYGDVDGANCGEMSLVFKGSTPEAHVVSGKRTTLTFEESHTPLISRAINMDQIGRLPREEAARLDLRYNLSGRGYRFDALSRRYALRSAETTEPTPTPEPAQEQPPESQVSEERDMGTTAAAATNPPATTGEAAAVTDPPADGNRSALASSSNGATAGGAQDFTGRLRALLLECRAVDDGFTGDPAAHLRHHFGTELPRLRERAELGENAMTALREEVKAEGVRAFGKDAMPPFYEGIIDTADMPTLRSMKEHWRSQAAERGLVGGRGTVEQESAATAVVDDDEIPDFAYSAR